MVCDILRNHPLLCGISMGLASVLMDLPDIVGQNQRESHVLVCMAIWSFAISFFAFILGLRWASKHRLGRR